MQLFFIECRTGCSCCSYENHYRGPYVSKDDADRRVNSFLATDSKWWPVASQFAKRGRYNVCAIEVEPLPDGLRWVIGQRIHGKTEPFVVNADGSVDDKEAEVFCSGDSLTC